MSKPRDPKLYDKIKKEVYKNIPKHSAYRSGIIVQKYKKAYLKIYKKNNAYIGKKTKKKGLKRWFDEKWVNQRGKIGYKYKNDIYRPSKRITKKTPITHNELTKKEIKRARKEKYKKGRVKAFRKSFKSKKKKLKGGKSKIKKKTKKKKKSKRKKMEPKMKNGRYVFEDFLEFKPNLSPREMFKRGSFGGTYWRPIYSSVVKKDLKNIHKKYPKSWWKNIPDDWMIRSDEEYDKNINKYKVKVGTSLEFWEGKNWIKEIHPYGWVHWYCDFFNGKRCDDDERQVSRWKKLAGHKGRFMRFLVTQILKKSKESENKKWCDMSVSPKIRQVLQHWAYELTKKDYDFEYKRRKSKK